MSLPDVKVSPVPLSSTTRIAASASACRNASTTAAYIAPVSAFFFSGRLKTTSSTGPVCVIRTSLMGVPLPLSRLPDQIVHLQCQGRDKVGDLLLHKQE